MIVLPQGSKGKAEVQKKSKMHHKLDKDKGHIKAVMKESPILVLGGVNEKLKGSFFLWGYIYHFYPCQGKKYLYVLCLDWPIQVIKWLSPNANTFLRPTGSVLAFSQEASDEYLSHILCRHFTAPALHVLV